MATQLLQELSLVELLQVQEQFKVLHLVTEQSQELHLLMKIHSLRIVQQEYQLNNQLKHM